MVTIVTACFELADGKITCAGALRVGAARFNDDGVGVLDREERVLDAEDADDDVARGVADCCGGAAPTSSGMVCCGASFRGVCVGRAVRLSCLSCFAACLRRAFL